MTVAYVIDIGAACVFAFFMVRGALRGLTGEVVSLAGLAASIGCGWTFAKPLAGIILGYMPELDRTATELFSAVILFIAVSLIFAALGKMLKALARAANLSLTDHVMGALAGGLRAFVVVLAVYGVAVIFSPAARGGWMQESVVMKQVAVVWPVVAKVMQDRGWIDASRLAPPTLTEAALGEASLVGVEKFLSPDLQARPGSPDSYPQ